MSGPDLIDERFDDLVRELRAGEVSASPELRERVRAIVEGKPEPPVAAGQLRARWGRVTRGRRVGLVLVPVAAILAAAVGVGVFTSGSTQKQADGVAKPFVARAQSLQIVPRNSSTNLSHDRGIPGKLAGTGEFAQTAPAPSGSRAQIYAVDVQLRVSDLSETTKQAINLTRGYGGYLVTVDYGSGRTSGTAYLVLRIPIVKVQNAVVKLTALGTILNDHVSIQDIQGQLNQRYSQMQALKAKIAKIRANLTETNLTTSQTAFFEAALAQRLAQLAKLQEVQVAQRTRASFSTVSLDLETKKAAAVVPSKPGRIGQALHNIGRVLVTEAEVLIYILLIGAPFIALAALLWASRRTLRRRSEEQLLAR
jgi:Domain of unknown function (DUF4349)